MGSDWRRHAEDIQPRRKEAVVTKDARALVGKGDDVSKQKPMCPLPY